jgi:hypothetical protein
MSTTELVARYFELAAIKERSGAVPAVSYAVRDVRTVSDQTVARVQIAGDFPGSPVDLSFRFTFTDTGCIQALAIRI